MIQKSEFDWVSGKILPSKNDHTMWFIFFCSVGRRIHEAKDENTDSESIMLGQLFEL